jgi:hypothetical protein
MFDCRAIDQILTGPGIFFYIIQGSRHLAFHSEMSYYFLRSRICTEYTILVH